MLQNGLIILTFVWSLIRMVSFTHDSMTSVMNEFPIVHFAGIPCIWCFCFTFDTLCSGLFEIWRFSVQRVHSGIKDFRLLIGNYMVIVQTLFTNFTLLCHICCSQQLWHMTGFQLFCVNRDGCHMWGRKCSLFPENLIPLPLGSSWCHPCIIYTSQNLSVLGICLWISDWVVCLHWSGCFVLDIFYSIR